MKIRTLDDVKSVRSYMGRVGAEPRSLKTAVIKEQLGTYWKEIAVIRFTKDGEVSCSSTEHEPTDLERAAIKAEMPTVTWPQIKPLYRMTNPHPMIKDADRENIFEFKDAEGRIIFVQVRIERENGDKNYVPFTYWDDDEWRMCEPDGALPLFNADKLKGEASVFIHEGAKAARHMQWMAEAHDREARAALAAHPWGRELSHSAHVGWVGGAMNSQRTDWGPIKSKNFSIFIVADNDRPGLEAVSAISKILRCPMAAVQFDDRWKIGFDLADPWPERADWWRGDKYIGPSLNECIFPATWATYKITNSSGKGRPSLSIRKDFAEEWFSSEDPNVFVHQNHRNRLLKPDVFNRRVRPFSHAEDTARLLGLEYASNSNGIVYRPSDATVINEDGRRLINTFQPAKITPLNEEAGPWQEFMEHLIPDDDDRLELMRWCATLIARPEVRITYGVLLISENQGVGKSTLGEAILAPLLGRWNVSTPSEHDVVNSDFNGWLAHKRLAIVHEIYSGQTKKPYNRLKSIITDPVVEVNKKYIEPYTLENWCHIFACSNSFQPLHLDDEDRRWMVPGVTEILKPEEWWRELHHWLKGDGLSSIAWWASEFVEKYGAVVTGRHAPMTSAKRAVINESRSDGQRLAYELAERIAAMDEQVVLRVDRVREWVASERQLTVSDKILEKPLTLRKALKAGGLLEPKKFAEKPDSRMKIEGGWQYVVANFVIESDQTWGDIKEYYKEPAALAEM